MAICKYIDKSVTVPPVLLEDHSLNLKKNFSSLENSPKQKRRYCVVKIS